MDLERILASRASRMRASEIRELLKLLDQPDILSFAGGIPDPALFPTVAFRKAFADALSEGLAAEALQYSLSEGYLPLREWLADHMEGLGVPCDAGNILITSGSQQALDYLGKLFLSPGDTALVNWPTYLGALGAFNAYEPEYDRLVANSNRSADDYRSVAASKGGAVKFAYMSVDFANPTGETLTLDERENILDLADQLDCAVIEDAAYQALRYDGDVLPPVLALDVARKGSLEESRVIYCGSFSKTLSPGLRVGWICAAKPVISRLVLLKQASDLHSSTINQMAVHSVAESCFDDHVAGLKKAYRARRDVMLQALGDHMPDTVSWSMPEGGMFVWLTLPAQIDGAVLLEKALRDYRIAFVPGRAFFADGSGGNTIRLNFSLPDEAMIREGIRRLGSLLEGETEN